MSQIKLHCTVCVEDYTNPLFHARCKRNNDEFFTQAEHKKYASVPRCQACDILMVGSNAGKTNCSICQGRFDHPGEERYNLYTQRGRN